MLIRLLQKVVHFPFIIIVTTLIITIFFIYHAGTRLFDESNNLIIDSTMEPFIPRESGVYDFFLKTRETFGNEEVMIVALKPGHNMGFDLDMFRMISHMIEDFRLRLPEVDDVISITNVPRSKGPCRGKSYFYTMDKNNSCESILNSYQDALDCMNSTEGADKTDFYENDDLNNTAETPCTDISLTKEVMYHEHDIRTRSVWQELKANSLFRKDIISPDHKTVALIVIFNNKSVPSKADIQKEFQSILDQYRSPNLRIAYTGSSRTEYLYSVNIAGDMTRILPFSMLLMMLILTLSFKSFRGVVIPLIVIFTGITWTFGLFALTEHRINMVSMVLPPLLICIGCAYIIHFLNCFYLESKKQVSDKNSVIPNTIKHISVPLCVTAMTTIAGFAALTVSPIPAIREMGIFACFGIGVINLLNLTLVPSILSLLPPLKKESHALKDNFTDKILGRISENIGKNSRKNIIFWIVIGIFAVMGIFMVTVDSKTRNFPADSPIEQDLALIQENLAGTSSLRLILSGKTHKKELQTAQAILGILALKEWLIQANHINELSEINGLRIDKVYSAADFIKIWRNGYQDLTDSDVISFFSESKRKKIPKYLSEDEESMLVTIRMKIQSTNALLKLRDLIKTKTGVLLPELNVQFTGNSILSGEAAQNISKSQIQSIALALSVIFIILSILFMSVKMGFIALYPNIIAIAIFFGTLGWIDIPIGATISVIASIALGIGVDDTIHFLSHFNENVKITRNEKEASLMTLRQTGKPMIYTTLALGLGFIIFYLAQMNSQVMFGLLTAYTLTVCLITDLNFLPSIMAQTRLITAWDYLGLRYSSELIQKIDIFRDMTLRETKLASLMAYTQKLKKGEFLFREKQIGNELYVILKGEIKIYLDKKYHGKEKFLAQFYTGSTLGEMGLFRHTKRSATAEATDDTHLLVINKKVLIRLHKRYPVIATKLFINIARNLSYSVKKVDRQIHDIRKNKKNRFHTFIQTETGQSVKEVVETIITDGFVTYEEERLLNQLVHSRDKISDTEQKHLDFLDYLIRENRVIKKKPPFLDIFQDLKPKHKKWLKKHFQVKHVPDRIQAFSQETYGHFILLVLNGGFTLEKRDPRILIKKTVINPGSIIGIIAFLTGDCTQNSKLYTNEESEVIYMNHKDLEIMKTANIKFTARFYYNIVCMLSDRLEEANTQLFYESLD